MAYINISMHAVHFSRKKSNLFHLRFFDSLSIKVCELDFQVTNGKITVS